MVLEHIPESNFEYIKQMVLSFNQEKEKLEESRQKHSRLVGKLEKIESKVELVDYWRQQAVFNQTLLMQQTESGHITKETIRMLDS